jgi:hypothetical protein
VVKENWTYYCVWRGLVEKVQFQVLASLSPKLETGAETIMEGSNHPLLLFPTKKEYHF